MSKAIETMRPMSSAEVAALASRLVNHYGNGADAMRLALARKGNQKVGN